MEFPYHSDQCDSKVHRKKLARFNLANLHKNPRTLLRGAIFLDPSAQKALSPADDGRKGIVGHDCSWEEVELVFPILDREPLDTYLEARTALRL